MSTKRMSRRKKWLVAGGIFLLILAILVGAFFWYVSDYYRAEDVSMKYMTVREAAEKWQVSQRLAQKLCTEGRIEGAQKFGGSWAIPADAQKPENLRRNKRKQAEPPKPAPSSSQPPVLTAGSTLMPLMITPFTP